MASSSRSPAGFQSTTMEVQDGMGGYTSSLQRLQKRAFGGEDVAARPGAEDDEWWPKGPLLPGIKELIDDFVHGLAKPDTLRLVFLLGGAGNGKSFVARALGKELGLATSPTDALAQRIYKTTRSGTNVAILNDATIAPSSEYKSQQDVALATDIQDWWKESASQPVAAFCCVNRGIVVDELRALADHGDGVGSLARGVLAWLVSANRPLVQDVGGSPTGRAGLGLGPHYDEVEFLLEGRTVRISALSVDVCSLMDTVGSESRAGALFQQVVQHCQEQAIGRPANCPIRANVMQWLSPNGIRRWESVLTHSEIASGRLHSYRDVWGLAALGILGSRYSTDDGSRSLLEHVDRCLQTAGSTNSVSDALMR